MPGDPLKRLTLLAFLVISTGDKVAPCVPACAKSATSAQSAQSKATPGSLTKQASSSKQTPDWSSLLKGVAPLAVKHYHLGQAHLAREHFDQALAEYDVALKIDKKTPVHEGRASCYAEQGRYKEAAADLRIAIARISTAPRNKFLGEVLAAQNLDKEAIDAFSNAIKIDANDFWSYKNRGDIYLGQKNFKQAIADYSKLIQLAPKEPIGYNCRARAYKQSGRQDLADKDNKHVRSLMDAEALF